ncbi:hem peroxidase, partial [Dillenia turbinata]
MAAPKTIIFTSLVVLSCVLPLYEAVLDAHFYDQTCQQAEDIILKTVHNASINDPKVSAHILQMFFHDSFIRDASILLDSTPGNQAEKDGPNISVRAFYVIDEANAKIEKECPHTVSCADIIAIAARDVIATTGGPHWRVLKGRKDGRVSKASETLTYQHLHLTQPNLSKALPKEDLVALSGSHTLGFPHCSSFEARLHNFSSVNDFDPSMNIEFAKRFRNKCPKTESGRSAGEFLDLTSSSFDNVYYKQIVAGKGLLGSDQTPLGDYRTRGLVESFAKDKVLFFREFTAAMFKLGNVGVMQEGKVRLNCRVINRERERERVPVVKFMSKTLDSSNQRSNIMI